MEGPSRSTGFRQSRRSRSQRDRERRRRRVDLNEQRATSLSSGSDQERACGTNGARAPGRREGRPGYGRHRPPRRRKRESVSCEEDIIDGFAIASFISLEALEMDCSLKPNQRTDMPGRRIKAKRGLEQNGGGPLTDPEAGGPHSFSRNKRRKMDEQGMPLETGYICDTESDSGDKASENDVDPVFTVSTRKVVEQPVTNMGSAIGKNGPPLQSRSGSVSRLMVTPRVSGLERSQEKSQEQNFTEPVTTSTSSASLSCLPSHSSGTVPRPNAINGSSNRHSANSPLSKPKPFLTLPGRSQHMYGINRSSTPVKPTSSASSIASAPSSMRPPTPSTSVSLPYVRGSGSSLPLRPPSRASAGALFTSSPGLPPPPPLLQGPSLMSAAEREGRRSVPGSENATAGRATPGGPSASTSTGRPSSRTSQNQPSIQPLAFQFHQHNHQHQHTHTHQHFTPFQYPPAAAPPLFEKYGKMNELYRHPFFPQFPSSVPSIQPVIPPAGPFSSLQGAFQPKPLVPQGAASDLTARLGVVPHHLQAKDPRLTDPFGTSLKISNKQGKWCAMHVYVAWMILSHQKKVKLMQADPHKLDFRSDLLARFPGASGLGPLGPMGGALPSSHELTRPPTLFSATGGVNPSSAPFISPPAPHSSFLTPSHLDPYGRSPPFTPLGALGSGAFGGLGSPSLGGSVFGPKDSPASVVGGLTSNHHDPWSRLHSGPPGFPGPSWAKGSDKRDERDRGKDSERRDIPHIKDEKDRDSMLYGRPPVRMSPVGPAFKPRSSTPVSHINGHTSALGTSSGPIEDLTRSLNRDRDRERDRDADKRPLATVSSRGAPVGSSTLLGDRERPRSSSSSVLTTPPPSNPSAPSPLDLYPRTLVPSANSHHSEPTVSQREVNPSASSTASSSVPTLSQSKKSDRTTTPVSKSLLVPPVKVKEERKEEPEHIPITLPPPPASNHNFDRPNSHPHHPSSGTPSSSSLTSTPGVPLPPPTPNHHLSLLDRSRAIDAYLGGAPPGLVVGPGAERFHPGPTHGPSQGPHSFTWDPWRELAAQHQQQQQRREALALRSDPHLALRSDPHLARLLQHQRLLEAERVAAVAAAAATPHHPPTSTSTPSSSAVRQEFSLMAHPFDRPHQLGHHGGGLIDEEQRAQILREDFERARYFGMHPHLPPGSHLSSPSHAATAAHLEQLHPGLLSHPLPPGASAAHHPGLYSRLGPLNPHLPNGILAKTPAGLIGALSVGAPPPLIPSIASRSSTPPRRLGAPGELALYSAHKDGESR